MASDQPSSMRKLTSRRVDTEEAIRLGVEAGWYTTKANGTFVTGPHATTEDCNRMITKVGPVPQDQRI
jgi:hypothetical protein